MTSDDLCERENTCESVRVRPRLAQCLAADLRWRGAREREGNETKKRHRRFYVSKLYTNHALFLILPES